MEGFLRSVQVSMPVCESVTDNLFFTPAFAFAIENISHQQAVGKITILGKPRSSYLIELILY